MKYVIRFVLEFDSFELLIKTGANFGLAGRQLVFCKLRQRQSREHMDPCFLFWINSALHSYQYPRDQPLSLPIYTYSYRYLTLQ